MKAVSLHLNTKTSTIKKTNINQKQWKNWTAPATNSFIITGYLGGGRVGDWYIQRVQLKILVTNPVSKQLLSLSHKSSWMGNHFEYTIFFSIKVLSSQERELNLIV